MKLEAKSRLAAAIEDSLSAAAMGKMAQFFQTTLGVKLRRLKDFGSETSRVGKSFMSSRGYVTPETVDWNELKKSILPGLRKKGFNVSTAQHLVTFSKHYAPKIIAETAGPATFGGSINELVDGYAKINFYIQEQSE